MRRYTLTNMGMENNIDGIKQPLETAVPKSIDAVRAGARAQERKPKNIADKPNWFKDLLVGKEMKKGLEELSPEELIDQAREEVTEAEVPDEESEEVSIAQLQEDAQIAKNALEGAKKEEGKEVDEGEGEKEETRDERIKRRGAIREKNIENIDKAWKAKDVYLKAKLKYKEEKENAKELGAINTPELEKAEKEMLEAESIYNSLKKEQEEYRNKHFKPSSKEDAEIDKESKNKSEETEGGVTKEEVSLTREEREVIREEHVADLEKALDARDVLFKAHLRLREEKENAKELGAITTPELEQAEKEMREAQSVCDSYKEKLEEYRNKYSKSSKKDDLEKDNDAEQRDGVEKVEPKKEDLSDEENATGKETEPTQGDDSKPEEPKKTKESEPEEPEPKGSKSEPKKIEEPEPKKDIADSKETKPEESEPKTGDGKESKQKSTTESVETEEDDSTPKQPGENKEGDKSDETSAQETEKIDEAWKQDKEQYMAYRREVIKAKKTYFEKSEAYEKEKRSTGVLARLMATPKLAEAKEEMLAAQRSYDEKLSEWRDRKGDINASFIERQKRRVEEGSISTKEKELIDKKNEERGEGYVNYIARHEAILKHHIDNEVSTLERLRYNENEKGESRYMAVRMAKKSWNWYRQMPKAGRIAMGVGFGFLAGGSSLLGASTRTLARIFVGGYVGVKVKEIGDEWAEEKGEQALQKQYESFSKKDLGTSREELLKIRRNIRTRKKIATGAALVGGWVVGGAAADILDPESLGDGRLVTTAHAGTMPEGNLQDVEKQAPAPSTVPQNGPERMTPPAEQTPAEIPAKEVTVEKLPAVPLDDGHPENLPPSSAPQDGPERMTPSEIPLDDGHPENLPPRFDSVEEASTYKPTAEPYPAESGIQELLKKLGIGEEAPENTPPLKDVPPYELPKDVNVVPAEPTPEIAEILPDKDFELKGVYEARSSVEGELQDFLKNDAWIREKYPDLSDVERGKIAHLIQQEVANDPEMMKDFNIKGGDWHNVGRGDTYDVTLSKDLIAKHIEAVHPPEDAPVGAIASTEKPFGNLPLEDETTVPQVSETAKAHTSTETLPKVEKDLLHAQDMLEQQGVPDYHGAKTLPALKSFFNEGVFNSSSLAGQRAFIQSYWGPMSHARLDDVLDRNNSISYTIGNNAPVTMGAEVEQMTRNMVLQLERSLENKIPNVGNIVEQCRQSNFTLGQLVNELHLRLEQIEPGRPRIVDTEGLSLPQSAPEMGASAQEGGTFEGRFIPLEKYEVPKVEWVTSPTEGTQAVVKLPPIEVSSDIQKLVNLKYPIESGWGDASAHELLNLPNGHGFREMLHAQLVDIAVAMKDTSDTPLAQFKIDLTAFEGMSPAQMMMQLEQHEEMIKKMHQVIPQGNVIETRRF